MALKVGVIIHRDGEWYVAIDPVTGVASQGKSIDEALSNFQEAFELWFENAEPWEKKRSIKGDPIATVVVELKNYTSLDVPQAERFRFSMTPPFPTL